MKMEMIKEFKKYLEDEKKSTNTIKCYILNLASYIKWFKDSFNRDLKILYKQNILDYKSFLMLNKKYNSKTINNKLSALKKFNEFLIEKGSQSEMVIKNKDMLKIQTEYTSPTTITEAEVKYFLQIILETGKNRNYFLVVLLAYTGLRISESLDIKKNEFNLVTRECLIKQGKNKKQRTILLNDKVVIAFKEYLKERNLMPIESNFLFVSNRGTKLSRITINQLFNKYSTKITPHKLRHFFCTNAIEKGMSIHEVAYLAGHSNIHTTLLYTNPDKQKMIEKMNAL